MIERQRKFDNRPKSSYFSQLFGINTHIKSIFETCASGAKRLKSGPLSQAQWDAEVSRSETWGFLGYRYVDYGFEGLFGQEGNYWWVFQPFRFIWTYELDAISGKSNYKRLSELDGELYNSGRNLNTLGWWREVSQGHLGDCTFISALSSVGKRTQIIKEKFYGQTSVNAAGLYGIRLYIRGKPWLFNIDDSFLFHSDEDKPWYSRMSATYPTFWGVLLEKSWAKAFGNYQSIGVGGYATQSLRALTGAPSSYLPHIWGYYTDTSLFQHIYAGKAFGFHHNAGTNSAVDGTGDTSINECGITYRHSYSIMDAIQLYEDGADSGTVIAYLYMMKDPRGPLQLTDYNGAWNTNDTTSWTPDLRQYIIRKYGLDPTNKALKQDTGIFFMGHDKFFTCFSSTDESWDRSAEGYSNDWFDIDDDDMWGAEYEFHVTVPAKSGDLYFLMETYYYGQVAESCYWSDSRKQPRKETLQLYQNDHLIEDVRGVSEALPSPLLVREAHYSAGDKFKLITKYEWHGQLVSRDFTVSVYSKQNLAITDKYGKTNMLHYDGNQPSGFMNSEYSATSKAWTAPGIRKAAPPPDISMSAALTAGLAVAKSWAAEAERVLRWMAM